MGGRWTFAGETDGPITTYNVTLFASDCALLLFLTLFICVERRCIDYHTMACD